jgi:single-strand DNA-binding protein
MAITAEPATKGGKEQRPTRRSTSAGHCNEVLIVGRLSMAAQERVLPSGDAVVSWRLVVQRPPGAARAGSDVIDCAAFNARVRRSALAWEAGAVIRVEGALRRRFWRAESGTASRYEIEVSHASRVT